MLNAPFMVVTPLVFCLLRSFMHGSTLLIGRPFLSAYLSVLPFIGVVHIIKGCTVFVCAVPFFNDFFVHSLRAQSFSVVCPSCLWGGRLRGLFDGDGLSFFPVFPLPRREVRAVPRDTSLSVRELLWCI